MVAGLLAGRWIPGLNTALSAVQVDGISLPIALGLLVMMYPVLAKVRYDRLGTVTRDRRLLWPSLVLNWLIGPALMFALAWLLLPDLPEYRTGLIIVGLARCIAMVIIWNDLACGDREAAAVLVALNSVFQVLAFGLLGWFYLSVLPGWLGLPQADLAVSGWQIAKGVLIFLGIPLVAGYLSRRLGERAKGRAWYEREFLPKAGPIALYGLLFTIVVLFALQGGQITSRPLDVARIAVPLLVYFGLMWAGSFALGKAVGLNYERTRSAGARRRDRGRLHRAGPVRVGGARDRGQQRPLAGRGEPDPDRLRARHRGAHSPLRVRRQGLALHAGAARRRGCRRTLAHPGRRRRQLARRRVHADPGRPPGRAAATVQRG
jgi:ACR3 family arsenite transporter